MNTAGKMDEEIAAAVQNGDIEAFGALMERYEPKMARYARKFFANKEDIKDIVQDVFIKAYTNIQSFDAARKFSPWIYRVAHNEFVNALKKKSRSSMLSFDLDIVFPHPVASETAESEFNKQELQEMLDHFLAEIDEKYREPLVLYYFEDFDYKEIAEILQIPISTVGIRLQRGKAILKKLISKFD
jgi:RNA polymerase sigma-70 factor (ECF subfamily)